MTKTTGAIMAHATQQQAAANHSLSRRRLCVILATSILLFTTTMMVYMPCLRPSSLAALGLAAGSVLCGSANAGHPHARPLHNKTHQRGAVASESAICSRIGADILEQGGNAADAMVATVFCTGVIGMYHSGIGGGGFVLVRRPDGTFDDVDFREAAPEAMNETVFVGNVNGSVVGGLASGVPGEVRGLAHLSEQYGVLPWKDLVMPAVNVARNGFPVSEDLVRYMNFSMNGETLDSRFLEEDPNWAMDFAPHGKLVGLGETLTRKRYADTLETIANQGPDVFYKGAMARAMIKAIQASNGTMTMQDLADYSIKSREPVSVRYRNHTLFASSAPASGAVALSALNILEGYPDLGDPHSINLTTHRLAEAFRFAYGQRTTLGDPSLIHGLAAYQDHMLNASTAASIRTRISNTTTYPVSHYNPSGLSSPDGHGTSQVVTADSSGLSLSLTTTVNLLFGSRVLVPETGVILNDQMNDFSIPGARNTFGYPPSANNFVRPRARPLSSCAPIIVHDPHGNVRLVAGAAGGSRIVTASALQVWNVLDRGLGARDALAAPRLHDQLVPDCASLEAGWDEGARAFMRELGHKECDPPTAGLSAAQSIGILDGVFEAASEPRQRNSGAYVV